MGNLESIEYTPESKIIMEIPNTYKSRSLIGDVIAPIKGLLTEAFNEFKGPVSEIVHFVVTNVLGSLIKFLTNAIIEIFPGLGSLETNCRKIAQMIIDIIPAIASEMKSVIENVINILDNTTNSIVDDIKDVILTISTAFDDLKIIGQLLYSRAVNLVSKTAVLIENAGIAVTEDTEYMLSTNPKAIHSVVNEIYNLYSNIRLDVSAITRKIFSSIEDGVTDTCLILKTSTSEILTIAKNVAQSCDNIADDVVNYVTNIIQNSIQIVTNEINDITNNLASEIQDLKTDINKIATSTEGVLGAVSRDIDRGTVDTVKAIKNTSGDAAKVLRKIELDLNDGFKIAEKIVNYIRGMSEQFAFAVVIIVLFIGIMIYRDIKKHL